ncbi:MAG: hypothetical protein FWF90_03730 [Promicromonosporaceae bacterium]|nr:hypothetical protein [Promicromonosporaceae bacterium]
MTSTTQSKKMRIATITLAGAGIAVTGAGMAFAAPGHSDDATVAAKEKAAIAADANGLPAGYTSAEYAAFAKSGYSGEDLAHLEKVWNLDATHTKAQAGKLLLAGKQLPFAPGTYTAAAPSATQESDYEAAINAGYSSGDIAKLQTIWHLDYLQTKAHLGDLVLKGQTVPVQPSGFAEVNAQPQLTPAQAKAAAAKNAAAAAAATLAK